MRDLTICVNKTCPLKDNCARKQDPLAGSSWAQFEYGDFEAYVNCDYFIERESKSSNALEPRVINPT